MNEKSVRPLKRAVIKEEYIAICGDMVEAVILNQMIYWSERVSDYDRFVKEEKARRSQEGKSGSDLPLLYGWIHKSALELKDEIMSSDSPKTIMRKLDNLVQKGFLARRNNPDHPCDRIYQYRVDFGAVIDALAEYGYSLEGFKVEKMLPANENPGSMSHEKPDDTPKGQTAFSKGQFDTCYGQNGVSKGQSGASKGHFDLCKGLNVRCKSQRVPAIPEITPETTPEITLSPSYSPNGEKAGAAMEDMTGEVSEIVGGCCIDQLRHKDMTGPVKALLSDLLSTGKVGRNQFHHDDVKTALQSLTVGDIDSVIDRFSVQAGKENISCPDDYLKASLLKAGRAAQYRKLAGRSGSDGVDCGSPSFNIDEYVRLSMERLHREGE